MAMRGRQSPLHLGAAIALSGALGVGWALAEFRPVLHEHFEPDPGEDLEMGVRVTSSGLPAAINARSGLVSVPSPTRPIDRKEPTYGERQPSAPERMRIDRETSDPGRLSYHEPFRPSIAPFKRTHALDAVNAEFELTVSEPKLKPVTVAGAPGPRDDEFFGDLVVELEPDQKIRVPSVGPHMTVYSAHLEPEVPFGFYVDGAENWFLRAPDGRGRARLVMHVGAARAVFDGRIEAASYSALASEMPEVPANVERVASQLLEKIGVSHVLAPADALGQLVTYFRGFAESKDRPKATEGEALYRELVLSRKGVCRHRAYAFVVTSLGLRVPSRFVHNEAHAWVEVFGGKLWHRIDLGGAAPGFDYRGEPPSGPAHRPPSETYEWPKKARSAEQSRPSEQSLPENGADATGGTTPSASGSTAQDGAPPKASTNAPVDATTSAEHNVSFESALQAATNPARGRARISISLSTASDVQRGQPLGVLGHIETTDGDCGNVRVDVALERQSRRFAVGTVATDPNGRFAAKIAIPADVPVGRYDLVASSPGGKDCPPASTE